MTNKQTDDLLSAFRKGLRPINNKPLWDWLSDNISLPNVYNPDGKFNIENYPYLKEPMLDLLNDEIKQVNIAACTQAGKSLLQQLFIPYILLESPGPVLMIHDTADNAKHCVEERIIPLLKNNTDTKRLLDSQRFSTRKSGIQLPHMVFRVRGPAESNLLGFTAKVILGDEIWQWEPNNHIGILEKLENRQTAYNVTRKILLTSQPDNEGSEWHQQCLKGLWYEYGYRCPHCNILQRYEWNETKDGVEYGMMMDKTTADANGTKDYDKKAGSARLVCGYCFKEIYDTPSVRKDLIKNGGYILIHEGKNKSVKTYSWPQYVNRQVTFKEIALKYLNAVTYKRDTGLRDKHQIFRQQTLGRFWQVGQQIDVRKLMVQAYSSSESWPDETIRFLTLDPQKDYINWLVRAWSNKVPECRMIDWGTIGGFAEVKELKKKYNIHPLCIGVDSGNSTREVYKNSVEHGEVITLPNKKQYLCQWVCLRGDGGNSPLSPRKFYKHKIIENGKTIEIDRFYSEMNDVDCNWPAGSMYKITRAQLYNWSNLSIKMILEQLRDNKLNFFWKLNERANADYNYQMFSEQLDSKSRRYEKVHDKNHVWDMECMQLVMALKAGCYIPSANDIKKIEEVQEIQSV